MTLSNQARVLADDPVVITGRLLVTGDSVLSHSRANEGGLMIEASTVQVDAGSSIDVTGRGYPGGIGYDESGYTLGGLIGASDGAGGSYGGRGAGYEYRATGPSYGDPIQPDELGSGGGAWNSDDGGAGGGRITITASEAVIVNGTILANGGDSASSAAGDGSGGSVWITTSRLAGTGFISADGGGSGTGTAGGGGRVAVYCDYVDGVDNLNDLYNITAFGGRGNASYDTRRSSAGTVFVQYSDQAFGDLYIDDNVVDIGGLANGTAAQSTELPHMGFGAIAALADDDTLTTDGLVTLLPNGLAGLRINPDITQEETFEILSNTADTITVVTPNENGVTFVDVAQIGDTYAGTYRYNNVIFRRGGNLKIGDRLMVNDTITIDEYGMLTHFDADTAFVSQLDLTVDNLYIADSGRIDVTGRGYIGGREYDERGRTLDNDPNGSTTGAGGSYGGLGGSYSGAIPNALYGSASYPIDLGSGGGAYNSYDGGDGGGAGIYHRQYHHRKRHHTRQRRS